MKCAFAVLCGLVVMGCANADLHFLSEMKECGTELGFTADQVMELVAKNDQALDCVHACVLEKIGGMNGGQLDKNALLSVLDQHKDTIPNYDQMRGNTENCYNEATSSGLTDKCQLGGKFSMCMQQHMAGAVAGLMMNGASQLHDMKNKFGR